MIIGLCGCKRSGKDTVARFLTDTCNRKVRLFAFADALRDVVKITFGFDDCDFQDDVSKETKISPLFPGSQFTPRRALQFIGTDLFRNQVDPDIWVKIAENKLTQEQEEGTVVIVTDVRFENEMNMLRRLGAKLWFVSREIKSFSSLASEAFVQNLQMNPEHRNGLFDYEIENDADLNTLQDTVQSAAVLQLFITESTISNASSR